MTSNPTNAAPVRPTFDTAGNQKVPLKKDAEGNDVPQAAPTDPKDRC